MKTVDKAFRVLGQFSIENREIGLSELARKAELDKAATRRLLVALSAHGFIEQNQETRKYRLGHGFLRLARIREATVPLQTAAEEVAHWLCGQVGETVHVSVPGAVGMAPVSLRLPNRGHVVNIQPAEILYYHATASGMAYLAHATPQTRARLLALKRQKITAQTLTAIADIEKHLAETRAQGYAISRGSLEDGVSSLSMPFGLGEGDPRGAISIALINSDLTPQRCKVLLPILRDAVARLDTAIQGGPA
jgi:DNA-binding IclR family transcriptional regulator